MANRRDILVHLNLIDKRRTHLPQSFDPSSCYFSYCDKLASLDGEINLEMRRRLMTLVSEMHISRTSTFHVLQTLLVARHAYNMGYRKLKADQHMEFDGKYSLEPDLYCRKGDKKFLVEVESGYYKKRGNFTETEEKLFRFIGKTASYASISNNFHLSFQAENFSPEFYNTKFKVPLIDYFTSDPEMRNPKQTMEIKRFVDRDYVDPHIRADMIQNAVLKGIFVADLYETKVEYIRY